MSDVPLTGFNPSLTTCNVAWVAKLAFVPDPTRRFFQALIALNASAPVPERNAVTVRVVAMSNHAILRGSK